MSHAGAIMAILERERRKLEIREVKYRPLHEAMRRAHERRRRSAELIELSETVVIAAAAARTHR